MRLDFLLLAQLREEQKLHALIQQIRQRRVDDALDEVERDDGEQHERRHTGDALVHGRTHGDDLIDRQVEQLGELRDQVQGIEEAAEDRHAQRADGHADDGGAAGLGKVADEGCARAFEQELEQHLEQLGDNTGHRSEIERAHEHRQLAQVHLIEAGRKKQRDLEQHEHAAEGGEHGHIADVAAAAAALQITADRALKQIRKAEQCREHKHADTNKGQVFFQHDKTPPWNEKHLKEHVLQALRTMEVRNIFYHPDYTVGIGIAPIQPCSARGLSPPVGNYTLPRRHLDSVVLLSVL